MKATFVQKHQETENIYTFWFQPEKPVNYIAGQFIEMTLKHPNPGARGIKRWFTLSSSPTDTPLISITTKFTKDGSTLKQALKNLEKGHEVLISEPMGDFVLPIDDTIPLVFVAGGIGITPFHSIIKWLIDTKQERDIKFLYSVNNEHEIIFQKLFENYGMQRTIIVDKPLGEWGGETGRLTGQRILELAHPADNALFYISGPESMVEALNEQLETAGIEKSRLIGDFFPGYRSL